MTSDTQPAPVSKGILWTGRVLSTLAVLMMASGAIMKLMKPEFQIEGMEKLGWPERYAVVLGILELTCTLIYAIPRTSVLGAVLLTGYLGGAIATHLRVGDPVFGPLIPAAFIWAGLYLREPRLRTLLPLRS